ncbi:MAG: HAMP domain-containing histidine kinase [Spirochaetales bacterium]|nr:HAMP domain-containing histidine kinase [Spirochaetales bacterium]
MYSDTNTIGIVGAGAGGEAILANLLEIPGIIVKYMCDINPDAPALELARKNNIQCITDTSLKVLLDDTEVDLIFEITGKDKVFEYLQKNKLPGCNVMGSAAARVMFHMIDTQQKITTELKAYKIMLAERVMERTDELEFVNKELQQQVYSYQILNEKLQEINDEKTKYLVNATHQLKAPFAAIQSYVDILLAGYADDLSDKVIGIVGKIKTRCVLLSQSIKEMLELANLNSCIEENIKMENVCLNSLIAEVIDMVESISEARRIEFEFKQCTGNCMVKCNPDQIKTLVQTLIENALNYSDDNSEIEVTLIEGPSTRVTLTVTDHGIGIAPKNLKLIFKEYFRSNEAVKKSMNGTGLGLSIAKRIAQIHRTDILVDSTLGEGSSFKVAFSLLQE